MSTIEECKKRIEEYNILIEHYTDKLAELEGSPDGQVLTPDEFKNKVKGLSDDPSWKEFVTESDILENISFLLKESYDFLVHEDDKEPAKSKVGIIGSRKWQEFTIKVIDHLLIKGHLQRYGKWDRFYDTANGCDELLQDAANYVIYAQK